MRKVTEQISSESCWQGDQPRCREETGAGWGPAGPGEQGLEEAGRLQEQVSNECLPGRKSPVRRLVGHVPAACLRGDVLL